jgi:hypothetical protein
VVAAADDQEDEVAAQEYVCRLLHASVIGNRLPLVEELISSGHRVALGIQVVGVVVDGLDHASCGAS